ncbi:hypothetical protein PEDI_30350 [Persicobacter diffluens]|uniref:Nicotinate-nucleotide--dimethylbenzimidazole phosphoribosyltransferase n=2 Tax=Persicobacter diffluens TaxID=981 RepID=A0AAN4VZ93_9BACT|nr:hypothetical protein PEDI_30350 [Persicobacter diffluens]
MKTISEQLQHKINLKTKPLGALGQLESIALQIGEIQGTLSPQLNKPTIVVFAGDHGIAKEGVSAYPQEVTFQMVMNFLNGGAAINVFARQNNIALKIVDAGVNFNFPPHDDLIEQKAGPGTASFLYGPAMTSEQLDFCFQKGAEVVRKCQKEGSNIIGFGEMGIGNTSAAAMIMSEVCQLPLEECVGRGTGVDEAQYAQKLSVLGKSQEFHGSIAKAKSILQTYGGFEIAQMTAGMLEAYELGMSIMVDGFIASAAFLLAQKMAPGIRQHAFFCHNSAEKGHEQLLAYLQVKAILNLGMRLGEGSGCAVAYPIIKSAVQFLNEMASFEDAGVSNKA